MNVVHETVGVLIVTLHCAHTHFIISLDAIRLSDDCRLCHETHRRESRERNMKSVNDRHKALHRKTRSHTRKLK